MSSGYSFENDFENDTSVEEVLSQTESAALMQEFSGQKFRLPNLVDFFREWPNRKVNEHYDDLVPYIRDLINK